MIEPKRYTIETGSSGGSILSTKTRGVPDEDGQWIFDPDHKIDIEGWIKFKARAPEEEGWYLVYYKGAYNYQTAVWNKNVDDKFEWIKDGSFRKDPINDPDYWMRVEIPK